MEKLSSLEKVIKSNALIEACHKLSVQEQKVLLLAISKIPKDVMPTDDVLYSISAQDLSQLNGQELKNCYTELKTSATSLLEKKVHIKDLPNGNGKRNKELITCWVQSMFYVDDEGKIEIRFSKDILPYVCQLKQQFTIYKIKNIGMMSSSYGIRLYEILIQYMSIGKREIPLVWLKEHFKISAKYSSIKDLKKWVIDPAVKDINNKSDIWVSWDQKKTGRRVTSFCFNFGLKTDLETKNKTKKPKKVDVYCDKFLAKNARPGESRDAAIRRLKAIYG